MREEQQWGVKEFLGKLSIVAGLVVASLLVVEYWFVPEKVRLAKDYGVPQDKVVIEPKPHGCDYDDAPLGNKHCHYEKIVDTEKACPAQDCRITRVYVKWRRVEE
jgi:hypothetical protein